MRNLALAVLVLVSRLALADATYSGVFEKQSDPDGACGGSRYGYVFDGGSAILFCVEAFADNLVVDPAFEVSSSLSGDDRLEAILDKASQFGSVQVAVSGSEDDGVYTVLAIQK